MVATTVVGSSRLLWSLIMIILCTTLGVGESSIKKPILIYSLKLTESHSSHAPVAPFLPACVDQAFWGYPGIW